MATVTLQPGAVTLGGAPAGQDVHTQSAVVGDPPQWADGSDATYATVNRRTHDSGLWTGSDYAEAPFDVFAPSESVTAITVTIRCSSTGVGTAEARCRIGSATHAATLDDNLLVTRGGSIQTLTGAYLDDDSDPEFSRLIQAAAALAEGATLQVSAAFVIPSDLTIYEASVVVTTAATTERATRLFPRDDALGLGSAPRIHPPPKRGRVVGGYT